MSVEAGILGKPLKRLEDEALLRGAGRFVDDMHFPGMLEAAFVRSPHAHARITGVDVDAAQALEGVHAVYMLDDLRPYLTTDRLVVGLPSPAYKLEVHRPVLASKEVTHVGEPVAVVLARSRYLAEDAAQHVVVEYDPLPVVVDCRAALEEGAPRAHENLAHNLVAQFDIAYGDVDKAFASAPHVIAEKFWQHRGGGHSMECRGGIAIFDAVEDKLTLWSSTQTPHVAMRLLCQFLDRDADHVRVVAPDVGGGFGPKLVFYPEDAVLAAAAIKCGRPVKWIEDRLEHFVATTQERDQYWDMEIAADDEGRILGVRGSLVHDHGAYTARGVNVPYGSAVTVTLPYNIPAYALDIKLALTNKVPVTPVRGAGQPQGAFVIERLMDRMAAKLGFDRAEIRRRNLVRPEQMPCQKPLKLRGGTFVILDSGDYPATMQAALEQAGWRDFPARKAAALNEKRYIGQGLATYVEATGRGPFEPVKIRIAANGRIHVYTGATAMGQGTCTMLAQIVGEQLGGDMQRIVVTTGDSAATGLGFGGFNSRQAVVAGASAHAAAVGLRKKTLEVAAVLLTATVTELEWSGDYVSVKGASNRKISVAEIAQSLEGMPGYRLPGGAEPGLEMTEHVVIDDMMYSNGAAIVEVEVDAETGDVRLHRFVLAHDCGRMINPMMVDGQIIGGIAHGIGSALFEWMGFNENGQPVTTNYGEYLLVTATEMPRIEIIHRESPSPFNALGVKGVGESGVIPAAAAIVSAAENALSPFGVRLSHAPLSPVHLIEAIQRGREAQ